MDGACEQLLTGATGAVDHDRAVAGGHCWQDTEQLAHCRAAADDVSQRVPSLELFPQLLNLAQVTVMDRTTLTRNLQILEKRGLITIKPGEDRREREVNLTDEGMEVLTKAIPLWEEAQERIRKGMGEERLQNLLDDLSEMISLARKQ